MYVFYLFSIFNKHWHQLFKNNEKKRKRKNESLCVIRSLIFKIILINYLI